MSESFKLIEEQLQQDAAESGGEDKETQKQRAVGAVRRTGIGQSAKGVEKKGEQRRMRSRDERFRCSNEERRVED